jgi:hypothetical protein
MTSTAWLDDDHPLTPAEGEPPEPDNPSFSCAVWIRHIFRDVTDHHRRPGCLMHVLYSPRSGKSSSGSSAAAGAGCHTRYKRTGFVRVVAGDRYIRQDTREKAQDNSPAAFRYPVATQKANGR